MSQILFLDTETTGLNVAHDEILQFASIDSNNTITNIYYNTKTIQQWERSEKIHHITPEMVKNHSLFSNKENLEQIQDAINTAEILVGYNIKTDIDFLKKYGIIFDGIFINDVLFDFSDYYGPIASKNYWSTSKKHWKNQKLSTAADFFNFVYTPHNALEDVKATKFVWEKLQEKGVTPRLYDEISLTIEKESRDGHTTL